MQLAEGGQTGPTAEAMNYLMSDSGASQAGMNYLMGGTERSPAMQGAMPAQVVSAPNPTAPSTQEFVFNPATGMYSKNPAYIDPEAVAAARAAEQGFSSRMLDKAFGDVYLSGTDSYADGGLLGLAKGGMKSGGFVMPADVTSLVGEGNTEAGYKRISAVLPGAVPIRGNDGGQADTVKTSIEGKQPARVAHGEMYVPPETLEKLTKDPKATKEQRRAQGAKKLYAMMDRVREQATGSKKQIKPVSLKKALA
jgi:hypothetical protein